MRTTTLAIRAIERVIVDNSLPLRLRLKWRTLLVTARRLSGERDRRGRPSKFTYHKIVEMHNRGMKIDQISEALRISEVTVMKAIRRVQEAMSEPPSTTQVNE